MPINILMPALSPTMTEGNVANWLKNEGDSISPGDLLCEIETDKATMEVESVDEGILGKIIIPTGTENVEVNTVIGIILEEGEEASDLGLGKSTEGKKNEHSEKQLNQEKIAIPSELETTNNNIENNTVERIFASPLAKRMAKQANLELANISGSGPSGRIVKQDIERAISDNLTLQTLDVTKPEHIDDHDVPVLEYSNAQYRDTKISNMRKVIASRLQESKQQVPHFYLTIDCEVDELLKTRKELNLLSENYNLSVNDFVIRACALALRKVPECNASWVNGGVYRQYSTIDISVAVSIEDGLITPVIKNADNLGLENISKTISNLAKRAREKPMGLSPDEYQGGSFSISNLGMFGIKEFKAIINPPQAMILAVGEASQRPIVKDGALAVATVMSCSLSVDHRVVDGATAANFLEVLKNLIEEPLTMLL
ncbi:MAG: pyruvate dehydrogenase complex dihydrolipoamide acetyltransferase [Gammaproteobacteria bacterium]|nr:pyruvate dehydrogenase complex dihydrolipoamide acetyltransferase [Gammaproteobacteria bacterium]